MTEPAPLRDVAEAARLLASGHLVGGVGPDVRVQVYAEAVATLVAAGRAVDIATMHAIEATQLVTQLSALLPASVRVADRSREGTPAHADVVVGELSRLAVDFMWQTMHGPLDQPMPPRDVVILDDAVELLHEGGGLEAVASTDEIDLLDRMRYADFIQQYELICGTSPYISSRAAAEMTEWYGLSVVPGGDPPAKEKSRARLIRRPGPDEAALQRWQKDRLAFAHIERDQRQALLAYRRELFTKLSDTSGVTAVIERWAAASPDNVDAVRSTLAHRIVDEGPDAISEYAREVMDRLIPGAWRGHLKALNELYDGLWGPNGSGGGLSDYAAGAHALYAQMLTNLHSEFLSYLAPPDAE